MMYIPANELSMNMHMHIIIYIFISQYVCILAPQISQITRMNSQSSFGAAKSSQQLAWWIFLPLALAFALAPEAGQIRPVELSKNPPHFYRRLVAMIRDEIFEGPCDLSNCNKDMFFQKGFQGTKIPRFARSCHALFLSGWLDL